MIYRITVINGRKYATAVKSREEFLALRDSSENLDNLAKARQGDEAAKRNLVQFAYNLGHVDGLIAGCKSIGSFFFHDIDCYDMSDGGSKMADVILSKKDEIGLMMLERSASGGWHLVCKRVPGTTILENQVRIACVLKVADMDNNARDLQRVVFGTSGAAEDLIYLDNELFEEPMSAEECEAEYVRLKERERNGEEQLPPSAKKANKHYKPWEEDTPSLSSRPSASSPLSSRPSEARGEISQMRPEAQAASRKDSSTSLGMTNGGGALGMTNGGEEPIRLNSGYRSPQLNRAIGGAPNSNHLTGCAVDIRVSGMEQLIRYAAILLDYADESKQDFDELLIEKNRYGAIWLHFAVRPKDRSATQGDACQSKNRRKVAFINA